MAENEVLITELIEKELVDVTLNAVDIGLGERRNLNDLDDVLLANPQDEDVLSFDHATGKWVNRSIAEVNLSDLVFNEIPVQVAGALYSVVNPYVSGTLQVFVNGLKTYATQITYDPNNSRFTLDFTPDGSDLLECNYVKQ